MTLDPLIIALDLDSAAEARALVKTLGAEASFYKVGMGLYAAAGPDFVRELVGQGNEVFLDLKFYDIGETVKRATAVVARTGARSHRPRQHRGYEGCLGGQGRLRAETARRYRAHQLRRKRFGRSRVPRQPSTLVMLLRGRNAQSARTGRRRHFAFGSRGVARSPGSQTADRHPRSTLGGG